MSDRKTSSPSRKKNSKYPSISSHNSHKLKRVTSTSSCIAESDEGSEECSKSVSQCSRMTIKPDDVTVKHSQLLTSGTNFNGKKPWNGIPKAYDNAQVSTSNTVQRESELIGMMSKQLYLAENQLQRMQTIMTKTEVRLKSKDQEINRLKRKVKDWETKSKNQEFLHKKELQQQRNQIENSEYLYKRCLVLEHKIYEMEKFLADYGLIWVGDANNNSNDPESTSSDYIKTCYAQLTANIEELNLAVGKGEVHVHHNQNGAGAMFKTSSCMCLKFYKNGLIVQEGPLRPYSNPEVGSFIRDILDGYFPSELQQAYPNGVPFKVEDHRMEVYVNGGFPGHGYRLGKQLSRESWSPSTNPRSEAASLRSRCSKVQRQNFYNIESTVPLLSSSARSAKSISCSEAPSAEFLSLRSQILASHNNNCSDSHIQSHINAELGLSARKNKKREVATRNTEYRISMSEETSKTRDSQLSASRFSRGSRLSYHSSMDRSSLELSPSRLDGINNGSRSRSRSASLSAGRLKLRSLSRLRMSSMNTGINVPKASSKMNIDAGTKKPHTTRSATLERKSALPLLRQINEPTGKPGELRLKVRSLNGSTVYLLYVCADDTVARLYQILDATILKSRSKRYKIVISGYAPKRLEQLAVSLREYGIARDSVLHLIND